MQTAIITGASSGIGAELARLLSKNNYEVALIGRNPDKLAKVKASLDGPGVSISVDLDDDNFTEKLKESLNSDFLSRLTLLVNNAGEFQRKTIMQLEASDYRRQNRLQIEVPALLAQFCYPFLKEHKSKASIINVSSSLGLDPVAMTAHYSAAKAGMVNLTKSMAIEFAPVRANCICPGIVDTPIHSFNEEQKKQAGEFQALGRVGTAQEIAQNCLFLAGEFSQWTTGISLLVDGGINLRN